MSNPMASEKACPFCAETIKAAAIVCRYCGRDLPRAGLSHDVHSTDAPSLLDQATALGISRADDRWIWRGNHFTSLQRAIEFARAREHTVTPHEPATTRTGSSRKWWPWLLATPLVVFVGSAIVQGLSDANRRATVEQGARKLPDTTDLLIKIREASDSHRWRADFACYTLAAASFKLAAARQAGLSVEEAADVTNDPVLMQPIAELGSNPRYVLLGLGRHVYDTRADPPQAFEDRMTACAQR